MLMEARVGRKDRKSENNLPLGLLHLRPQQSPEIKIRLACLPAPSLTARETLAGEGSKNDP